MGNPVMGRIPPSEVLRKGVHIGFGFLAFALYPLGPALSACLADRKSVV